ncbi:recombinase family protein [Actinomadura rupiterrae]|uniref:recombinase family protein n=1 Tax=Actinomadura rupiterrae TaxID=559627 RepID=UPI0020A30E78|nr:recombinase family protein [Actinomadura rupiterrae]MCP2337241.1 DNA invertase Pin-like site-specific DNA recombinase [Actinomadura rupiterrae]
MVSYARISADLKRDAHGVKDQHKVNRETAARLGWTVVHEFTDNDRSAAKVGVVRDDFEEMLKALRLGRLLDGTRVDGVVILAEDRLARRPGDYERFVEAFTHQDNRVFADQRGPKDLYSEDVEGMGLFGAVISKMEVRKMQRRMRRSHRARAEAGKPVGGPRPFGWQDDRLTLDPRESALLAQAAKDFLRGRSLHSIVTEWQATGVKTARGNDWSSRSLKVALTSPRICGWREISGELVRSPDGAPVVGQWEPIISPEQWLAIREKFEMRKGHFVGRDMKIGRAHPADYRDPAYLLSGILRCGRVKADGTPCNTPLRVNVKSDAGHHTYVCRSSAEGGCSGVSRRGDLVDEFVSEAVLAKLEEASFTAASDVGEWQKEAEYREVQEQLDALTRNWKAKKVTNNKFFELLPELEQELERLRAEKNKHEANKVKRAARASTGAADVRRRWYLPEAEGGFPISVKRAYIRTALYTVIVYPAGKGNKRFDPDLLDPVWRTE